MRSFKESLLESSVPKRYLYLAVALLGLPTCLRSEENLGEVNSMGRAQWISPQVTKISSPKPGSTIWFGVPVLVYENEVYAGAEYDDTGAVYVYSRAGSNWGPPFRLAPSDGKKGDQFGKPARSKDLLIAASANGYGAVYLFKQSGSTWKEAAKLTATKNNLTRGYTYPTIDENTIAIGSGGWYTPSDPQFELGAVYVLQRSGTQWGEQQILFPGYVGSGWAGFGLVNDIDGDTVVTAAKKENKSTGAAYIFGRKGTQWKKEVRIEPNDLKQYDLFGIDLALDGDTVVVGAYGQDVKGTMSGAIYVFNRSGTKWLQSQKIQPKDLKTYSKFGQSVDVDGDYMVVGAPGDSYQGLYAGAVYIFKKQSTKWIQMYKIYAPGGKSNNNFGYSVSIDYPLVATAAFGPTIEAIYIIELNVLVNHDGGPPGNPDLNLDVAPPPDTRQPSDSAPDRFDQTELSLTDDQQPPATAPGCSCTLDHETRAGHLIFALLFAGGLALWLRKRKLRQDR